MYISQRGERGGWGGQCWGTPGFKWQGGMIEGFFWVGKFWKVFFR